jgi:hypothetical protein
MNGSNSKDRETALSRERALARRELMQGLSKARTPSEKLDRIISSPHGVALVPTLPAQDLYLTLKEVGLPDALELVHLSSPAQFKCFIDLDAWRGDRVDPLAVLTWMRAARTDHDSDRYRKKLAALDMELLELLLRSTLKVHALDEQEDPEVSGPTYRSPEGRYLLEFKVEGADYAGARALLDDLYSENPLTAVRLIEAVRWEMPSELEEIALRWRTGRLADLGFPDLEEALSYFAYLDPDVALPALDRAPPVQGAFLLSRWEPTGRFLDEVIAHLSDDAREVVERQLVTVLNAVMVAERVDPGELNDLKRVVDQVRDTLSLGLEHASKRDPVGAAALLAAAPLKRIFQVGASLALRLKFRADRLMRSGKASFSVSKDVPLFDAPLSEVILALRRKRPLYAAELDTPGAEPRRFREKADLARVEQALENAEKLAEVMDRLGLSPQAVAQAVESGDLKDRSPEFRFSDLVLNAAANELECRSFSFKSGALPRAASTLERIVRERLEQAGQSISAAHLQIARDFADLCLARLSLKGTPV